LQTVFRLSLRQQQHLVVAFEKNLMSQEPESAELFPLNTIRTETVLSRFPVHRLAKRGGISIDIKERAGDGEIKTIWEVSHNSKYGQPGPLAYKVDSLIINRRVDEAPRPVPKTIKLGSLRDICRELDVNEGQATRHVKKALLQNASAFITAKRSYKGSDGTELTAEISDTRYGVIFTGEKFPDGRRADAVYIMLHDSYMEIINTAPTRPLDYDYLRELPPASQRLYELLSYQIFAALRNARPRAKMLYSYYCTRAPQTRYLDYDHVKKQMYKLHTPHKKSGYISGVELRETTDSEGQPDWEMLYTPGRRAKAEFREATKPRAVQRPKQTPVLPPPAATEPEQPAPAQIVSEVEPQELDPLVTKLVGFHIAEAMARELVRDYRKSVELQLRALPHRNLNKIRDLASWLIVAIKENHQLPEPIIEAMAKEEEVRHAIAKREAETARHKRREALQPAYFEFLRGRAGKIKKTQPEAHRAFLAKEAEERQEIENNRVFKSKLKERLLTDFDHEEEHLKRLQIFFKEPAFDEWLELNAAES
jgi:hypothetical protein